MEPAPLNNNQNGYQDASGYNNYPNREEVENNNTNNIQSNLNNYNNFNNDVTPLIYNSINVAQTQEQNQVQPILSEQNYLISSNQIQIPIPISENHIYSIDHCCPHYNLKLSTQIDECQKCLCYFCCFLGFIMLIIAVFVKCKDDSVSSSSYHNHSYNHGGSTVLLWDTHWLYYYGYDRSFVENRMGCHGNKSELESGCFGLTYPHTYTISCKDCGNILKDGHKAGGLIAAFIFGFVGLAIAVGCIVAAINA